MSKKNYNDLFLFHNYNTKVNKKNKYIYFLIDKSRVR